MKYCGEPFLLQINSIEDFIIFVRLIRGDEIDDATLHKLTARLEKSNTVLDEAVKDNAEQP